MKNSLIVAQNASRVIGVLEGWDRLVFRGCCPLFMFVDGMLKWLLHMGIRLTEFSQWALATSDAMKRACLVEAERRRRPIRYLGASGVRKDELARDILRESPVSEGLVCVLTCLEPCDTYRIRGAMTALSCDDVLRFMNKRRSFQGEVDANLRRREGVRIKHHLGGNTVKAYDKAGSVLRIETTISQPKQFRVFRTAQADPQGAKAWRPLRKSVADLHRRAEVSEQVNRRYGEALAALDTTTSLGELVAPICRPVRRNGTRCRALRPWSDEDRLLLEAVARGEYVADGFTNRDIAARLYPGPRGDQHKRSCIASRVSYRLRLLRAHGMIRKVKGQRRYHVTANGRKIASALLVAQTATLQQLNALAA